MVYGDSIKNFNFKEICDYNNSLIIGKNYYKKEIIT